MITTPPELALTHVVDAPRALVYQAFTDPDHLAAWWGPIGNSLPRDEVEFDVRPGGYQRWSEVFPAEPGLRVHGRIDLTDVVDGELLDGVMHITGQLPGGFEPFETRMRVEFYDETRRTDATRDHAVAPRAVCAPPAREVGARRSPSWTPCSPRTQPADRSVYDSTLIRT